MPNIPPDQNVNDVKKNDLKMFLSPSGAIIALLCFFLPWIQLSCAGKTFHISGASLGGIFWLLPILAGVMVGVFIFYYRQRQAEKSKIIIIACSIAALIIFVFNCIRLAHAPRPLLGLVKPSMVGFKIHVGGIGLVLGFILAMVGTKFLKRRETDFENAASKDLAT